MSILRSAFLALLLATTAMVRETNGHGKLMDPVSRSSAWRRGFNTPTNYDDNQLYCGGVHQDKDRPGMTQCGVCGDSYNTIQPRPNENGGVFGTGTIVRRYRQGQRIKALIDLSASHKGFFEFSVCPLRGPRDIETEQCFKSYPLKFTGRFSVPKSSSTKNRIFSKRQSELISNDIHQSNEVIQDPKELNQIVGLSWTNETEKFGDRASNSPDSGARASVSEAKDYRVPVDGTGKYIVELILPQGLSCKQCTLRWEYTGGNKWGTCPDGSRKLGCGPQETFRNCADISIQ